MALHTALTRPHSSSLSPSPPTLLTSWTLWLAETRSSDLRGPNPEPWDTTGTPPSHTSNAIFKLQTPGHSPVLGQVDIQTELEHLRVPQRLEGFYSHRACGMKDGVMATGSAAKQPTTKPVATSGELRERGWSCCLQENLQLH